MKFKLWSLALLTLISSFPAWALDAPSGLIVPTVDPDGGYSISWTGVPIKEVLYVLEEATTSDFSANLKTVYENKGTKVSLKGRLAGSTYYYRVKAKLAGEESAWVTTANGCDIPYRVTTKVNAGGTISPPPGLVTIPVGSTQTFTITPNEGYHIVSVVVDGVTKVDAKAEAIAPYSHATAYTVNAPADLIQSPKNKHKIAAKFKANKYNVTATAGSGGAITPSGTKVIKHGKMVKYRVVPTDGNRIVSVMVNGRIQGGVPASGAYELLLPATTETLIVASFASTTCNDEDGDGYSASLDGCGPLDCNDANAAIQPGAEDLCGDGIDQDCSGSDLVCLDLNIDNDGDGFTGNEGDCNDGSFSIHPGATEICGDGIDQSCAGGDLACAPTVTDYDGDGYSISQGDCDDFTASVHPGAVDIANDGYDQDCDGDYNGDKVLMAADTAVLDSQTEKEIISISTDGRINFARATRQINALAPGVPLLIGATARRPMGFMGKVVSVQSGSDGKVVVETEPASLNEAFETIKVVRKGSLVAKERVSEARALQGGSINEGLMIGINDVSAYKDCLNASPGGAIVNELCLELQADYSIEIDIESFVVNEMTFIAYPSAILSQEFGVNGKAEAEYTKSFPQVRYAPIPLGIPGLFMTPVIGASTRVGFKAEGEATITSTRVLAYEAQLAYQGGQWSNNLKQVNDQRDITKEVHARAEVSASISPVINLYINGVAGPYLQLDLTGKAVADPCADPWLKASVNANYSIGAKVRLLKNIDYEFDNGVIIPETIFWQSQGPFPYTGMVYGIVKDQYGKPIEDATVDFVQGSEIKYSIATDADGSYAMNIAPCTYDVKFSKCGVEMNMHVDNIVVDKSVEHNASLILPTNGCGIVGDWSFYHYSCADPDRWLNGWTDSHYLFENGTATPQGTSYRLTNNNFYMNYQWPSHQNIYNGYYDILSQSITGSVSQKYWCSDTNYCPGGVYTTSCSFRATKQ